MRLFAILFVLLGAVSANAQFTIASPFYVAAFHRAVAAAGGGDACSSCTNETFEGAGFTLTGWRVGDNSAGVITNADYATSPAPIAGSHSLLLKNPDSQAAYISKTIASSANVGWRFKMIITNTIVNNMQLVTLDDNVGGVMASFQVQATSLRVVHGTANATTVADLSPDTLYYVWGYRAAGSGANGVGKIAFSTSKTKPTSGDNYAEVTTGSTTANVLDVGAWVRDVSFGSGRTGVIIDDFSILPGAEIGDFP